MAKTNSKIKPVHFNLDNENDLRLFKKANKIGNFTQWVKDRIDEKDVLVDSVSGNSINKQEIIEIVREVLNEKVGKENDVIRSENKDRKIEKSEIDLMMM